MGEFHDFAPAAPDRHIERGAHYLLTIKNNQRGQARQLHALESATPPWPQPEVGQALTRLLGQDLEALGGEGSVRPAVRLPGAPVTTVLAMAFTALVLVLTGFVDAFSLAWKAGLPFAAALSYALVARRRRQAAVPLPEQVSRRISSSATDLPT